MISKIYRFIKYNRNRCMSLKAMVYSAFFRCEILLIEPKILHKHWGEKGLESPDKDSIENYKYAVRVSHVVNSICSKTKWESKCLVRALVAQKLLKAKNISSTLYLGCGIKDEKMVAHAWIRCGEIYVTGGDGKEYSIVSKFRMLTNENDN